MGGGRKNSVSILETIDLLGDMGYPLRYRYDPRNRVGDHICYISDLAKLRTHYPQWSIKYDLHMILAELIETRVARPNVVAPRPRVWKSRTLGELD